MHLFKVTFTVLYHNKHVTKKSILVVSPPTVMSIIPSLEKFLNSYVALNVTTLFDKIKIDNVTLKDKVYVLGAAV